jgi:hypothetical protein
MNTDSQRDLFDHDLPGTPGDSGAPEAQRTGTDRSKEGDRSNATASNETTGSEPTEDEQGPSSGEEAAGDPSPNGAEIESPLEALGEIGGAVGRIRQTVEWMEIAEEEIDRGQEQYPDTAEAIDNVYQSLVPTAPIQRTGRDALYRRHCRELIGRVGSGERSVPDPDLRVPTDAELVVAMADVSTRAPLSTVARLMYMDLFGKAMGEKACREDGLWKQVEQARSRIGDYKRRKIQQLRSTLREKLGDRIDRPVSDSF